MGFSQVSHGGHTTNSQCPGQSIFAVLRLLLLLGMTHISCHNVFQSLIVNPVLHVDGDSVGGLSRLLIWSQVQVHKHSSQVL